VVVQAWYPTVPKIKGLPATYLDGLAKRPDKLGAIPTQIIDRYDQIDTHAIREAPLSTAEDRWPVVLFLPGNGASRSFYTSLITHIASLGYVVLAIDHPYDAMITQLANGTVVTDIEQSLPPDFDRLQFMAHRTQTRIADVKFVLDELIKRASAAPFFSQLDVDRIVIAGHSLGGASGAMAMAFDPRIKAAVNIDGTTYGELPEIKSPRPFMLIESKKDGSDRFLRYEQGNQKLFHHFLGGVRYELPEADHFSFTDAPLFLTFPARSIVSHFFHVGNVPQQTYESTAAIVAAFFSEALDDSKKTDLDSVAGGYKNIVKKTTPPVE
jgi:predicted dienelactone hydrolase